MNTYRVTWEIDVEAESPLEAAERAREIQRDPDSTATVFGVRMTAPCPTCKRIVVHRRNCRYAKEQGQSHVGQNTEVDLMGEE